MSTVVFGEMLQQARLKHGYSLTELEEKTNISASYLFRLEKGIAKNPCFMTVCNLAILMGMDMSEILESFGYGEEDISRLLSNVNNT